MRESGTKAPRTEVGRKLRIWHFAVVVLATALVFGTIRIMAHGGPDGLAETGMVALVIASACGGVPYAIVWIGRKVAGRPISGLKEWGVRRGGLFGFLAWVVGIGVEFVFIQAAILIGPVAVIVLIVWLVRLAGR